MACSPILARNSCIPGKDLLWWKPTRMKAYQDCMIFICFPDNTPCQRLIHDARYWLVLMPFIIPLLKHALLDRLKIHGRFLGYIWTPTLPSVGGGKSTELVGIHRALAFRGTRREVQLLAADPRCSQATSISTNDQSGSPLSLQASNFGTHLDPERSLLVPSSQNPYLPPFVKLSGALAREGSYWIHLGPLMLRLGFKLVLRTVPIAENLILIQTWKARRERIHVSRAARDSMNSWEGHLCFGLLSRLV